MTDPKEVAAKLMGIEVSCRTCDLWKPRKSQKSGHSADTVTIGEKISSLCIRKSAPDLFPAVRKR